MSYTGVYDKTIYYNPVSKYCVISVKTNDQSIPQKARSAFQHRDRLIRFTAVGYELPQTDRVSMILSGEWQNGKYGPQLQVESCEEIVPQTKDGVLGYLSSRLIKGVGKVTAELIVERFGADALQILEKQPERLLEIRGITPSKLEEIKASYDESRCLRGLMILSMFGDWGWRPMDLSLDSNESKRKMLMKLPEECHLVTNGCEIDGGSRYYIDRENNVYIYLEELEAAVESEHTFACDDNGEQIRFMVNHAKKYSVITMEDALERLALVH